MATKQHDNKKSTIIVATHRNPEFPSPLHRLLGMSASAVDADIRSRGKTPAGVISELEGVVDRARKKHSDDVRDMFAGMADSLRFKYGLFAGRISEDDQPTQLDGLESLRFYEESVAAGVPTGDGGDIPYRYARGSDFFGQQDWSSMFVAKVSGWSMRGDHIGDGDVVLVDSSATPRDGDIVLAYIVGEGQVVKRLRILDGETIVLESANPDFKAIVIDDPSKVAIRGVVKGRAGRI